MIDNVRDEVSRKADTARNELDALLWLVRTAFFGAIVAAIWIELRKAPEDRTWNGKLLGVVPYDFRLPSLAEGHHRSAAGRRVGHQHSDRAASHRRAAGLHQGSLTFPPNAERGSITGVR